MLPLSRKPEVIHLHNLEHTERNKYISEATNVSYQWLPQTLWPVVPILADIYYACMTICKCKKRLGQEYNYVVKINEKQYEEEGVLMNRQYRVLMFVLEIVQRHLVKRGLERLLAKVEHSREHLLREISALGAEGILEQGSMFMMMLFMLGWNKHFNLVDTVLGTKYVYTYKNADQTTVDYRIEGLMLLAVFAVKAGRLAFTLLRRQRPKRKISKEQQILNSFTVIHEKKEESLSDEEEQLCRICYDPIQNVSSTCCGHIFCWECLIKHLETRPECPVCRTKCLPREVVQLQNY